MSTQTADPAVRSAPLAPGTRLVLLALALTAARLIAGALIPLTEDEAYYLLWARHLQAGYLDHPPMVAWWIRLGELVAGETPLGVRLVPCLATGLTTWLVGDLGRRIGLGDRTALRAALWCNATFTVALGGMLATPDTPACLFWTLAVWCLARLWQDRNGLWWLAAGFAAGLACLSKYSGLFLAPGVLLWLLLSPSRGLAELKRPWPWLAALCALAAFAPNILWNAAHDWMTFEKQFGRVGGHGLKPGRLPEFLITQILLLNPLIAALAARGAGKGWAQRRAQAAPRVLLPLAVATPFILYLTIHSLHDRVQGHWPVPAFGALAICAAFAAEASRPWLRRAVPALGLGLSALVLVYAALPRPPFQASSDPTVALRNWDGLARGLETLRQAQGAAWVGTWSYGVRAQLGATDRLRAPLVQIIERERYFDWERGADLSRPGLVLDLERRLKPEDLARCFGSVRQVAVLERWPRDPRHARYAVYRVGAPKVDVLTSGCPG